MNAQRPLFCCLTLFSVVGGIQRFNQRVVQTLVERAGDGPAPRILVLEDPVGPSTRADAEIIGFSGSKRAFVVATLRQLYAADLLIIDHLNLLRVAVLAKLLRPGLPILMFAHGVDVWGDPVFRSVRWYEPALLRRAVDRIACVSRYTGRRLSEAFGFPAERLRHLPNAVNPVAERPDRAAGKSPGQVLLTVTRLDVADKYKNVDKLIGVLKHLAPTLPDLSLVIVGDGTWRAELEEIARAEGVADRVRFLGRVSEAQLADAYAEATIFALPSPGEGFGIAYLEAWQRGLPVIGSTGGAAPEVIAAEEDGLLVRGDDVPELADAVLRLARDPALRQKLGIAGSEKVERLYTDACYRANLNAILDEAGAIPGRR